MENTRDIPRIAISVLEEEVLIVLNEFDTELVELPIFPPALANCANASVIRITSELIFGASRMALKNSSNALDSTDNWLAVCPVLFPALASLAIDWTNVLTDSETFPTVLIFSAALFNPSARLVISLETVPFVDVLRVKTALDGLDVHFTASASEINSSNF